jgi:hypothetical protein
VETLFAKSGKTFQTVYRIAFLVMQMERVNLIWVRMRILVLLIVIQAVVAVAVAVVERILP